ncbi:hypothetical protein AAMO2058_001199800 [Amorphochlora amoebiformis]
MLRRLRPLTLNGCPALSRGYSISEVEKLDDVILSYPAEGVAQLTLNNAKARNSLSSHMMRVLQTYMDHVNQERLVRVVILSANGPAFCAGHDLKEMRALREAEDRAGEYKRVFTQCSKLMQTVVMLSKPVIAQVEGIATAAGAQLVASCDMAIACEEKAKFATPGVNIGLFCSTPMVALSRNVPRKHAMEMLLTGTPITAKRAVDLGLANRAVPAERVGEETLEIAKIVASKSQAAVKYGKAAFYQQGSSKLLVVHSIVETRSSYTSNNWIMIKLGESCGSQ